MLSDVILRLRALFKRTSIDREIDDELRFHLEKQVESYQGAGLDRDTALRRARIEFGGLDQMKEEYRDALGIRIVDNLSRDLRLAVRSLRATPVVSAVAILSLALGIGANTAIFSIVNSLLLRPLPVHEPQQLALLLERGRPTSWTNPIWEEIRSRSNLFAGAVSWGNTSFDLAEGGEARMVDGLWANGSFFDLLGVRPSVGRTFTAEDDRRGGGPDGAVAVISHSFWQSQFGGTPDVIGRRITLNRVPFTIVGVAPAGFFGPEVGRAADVFVPLATEALMRGKDSRLDRRSSWWLNILIRLRPDQTLASAEAALVSVQPQIREATLPPSLGDGDDEMLKMYMARPFRLEAAETGRSTLRSRYQGPLIIMLVVVGLVLLIACANIANLLLARATARRHELSVRLALGASSWRLAQPLLLESLVLASLGAGFGLLFAQWIGPLIVAQLSTRENLVFLDLVPDWRLLAFTVGLTATTALIFGTVPALRASRVEPITSMKEGGRITTDDYGRRMAGGLIVAQVALSLILVVVAGLFVRTLVSLGTVPLGMEPDRVLLVNIEAPQARFGDTNLAPLFARVRTAVAALPGVAQAGLSEVPPVTGGGGWNGPVDLDGAGVSDNRREAWMNAITPRWFDVLGTPLLAGRDFTDSDREGAPFVAIVNQAFARQFGLGPNPVGRIIIRQRLRRAADNQLETYDARVEIVGLVADAVYSLLREPIPATVYWPLAQEQGAPPSSLDLSVRSVAGPPAALAKSVAGAIAGVNPDLVLNVQSLSDQIRATLTQERLLATLSALFGATALLLAGLGLYGVTSYAVSRRRNEIGIRMALGAAPFGVIRLVLTRVFKLVSVGVIIGGIASLWASRYVATLLFGLEPHDLATMGGSAALLAAVAALAGWLPARRAARIDPAAVLRES